MGKCPIFESGDIEAPLDRLCPMIGMQADVALDEQAEGFARFLSLFFARREVFLVLSDVHRQRYVQFAVDRRGAVLCETTSNRFLKGRDQLSLEDEERLLEYGWEPPQPEGGATGCGSPNWRVHLAQPVCLGTVALMTIRTLADVVHASTPREVFLMFFTGRLERQQPGPSGRCHGRE